jgi:hypothetical protein
MSRRLLLAVLLPLVYLAAAALPQSVQAQAPAISADGSTLTPAQAGGSLVTAAGTWTFGTPADAFGSPVLLNGKTTSGSAGLIEVAGGGQLWAQPIGDAWYEWVNGAWAKQAAAPPPVAPAGQTYSIKLTWTAPTQWSDGSPVPAGMVFVYGLSMAPNAETPTTPVTGAAAITSTSYTVTGLPAGTWCFSGNSSYATTTVPAGLITSDPSAIVDGGPMCATVPAVSPPPAPKKPMPPGGLTATPAP